MKEGTNQRYFNQCPLCITWGSMNWTKVLTIFWDVIRLVLQNRTLNYCFRNRLAYFEVILEKSILAFAGMEFETHIVPFTTVEFTSKPLQVTTCQVLSTTQFLDGLVIVSTKSVSKTMQSFFDVICAMRWNQQLKWDSHLIRLLK